jgi:hypothetical protein
LHNPSLNQPADSLADTNNKRDKAGVEVEDGGKERGLAGKDARGGSDAIQLSPDLGSNRDSESSNINKIITYTTWF